MHEFFRARFRPALAACVTSLLVLLSGTCAAEPSAPATAAPAIWRLDLAARHQRIHSFGASDAWAAQFVGRWPDPAREQVARLLFSQQVDANGRPEGIGLSAWRFNLGAGSAEQGPDSGIGDPWRRAECFLQSDGRYDWDRAPGQRWFLRAARRYGVEHTIAFVNSPPVGFTRNGRAWSDGGHRSNLAPERYAEFAAYLAEVAAHFEQAGLPFDFVSPFNEPQWTWSRKSGQEGCPWTNEEMRRFVPVLNRALIKRGVSARIVLPEAGSLGHLLMPIGAEPACSDQLRELFGKGPGSFLQSSRVARLVAGHGYHTTNRPEIMFRAREELGRRLRTEHPDLEFWMSEYCILGTNDDGRLRGGGRDLGMTPALFIARVIHHDLTLANAAAWHWWLAISPYHYKDGLVYVDKSAEGGSVQDPKMLWALGHFARFIRPGAWRIDVAPTAGRPKERPDRDDLLLSAFWHPRTKALVVVGINPGPTEATCRVTLRDGRTPTFQPYVTRAETAHGLQPGQPVRLGEAWPCPPRSITTWTAKL